MHELAKERAPRAWEIRPAAADGSGGWLRIGHRAYALNDISGLSASARSEPNIDGHLALIAAFVVIGLACLLPALLELARPRYVIGAIVFLSIAAAGTGELARRRSITFYRLDLRLVNGASARFATTDAGEYLALRDELEQRLALRPGA